VRGDHFIYDVLGNRTSGSEEEIYMKRFFLVLATMLGLTLFTVVGPLFAQTASGTVKSVTMEECDFIPGTCVGILVVQSGDQERTFAVPRGAYIMHGDHHWILLGNLRPSDPVTVNFVLHKGKPEARVVRLERRPLPGEMQTD